MKLWHGALFLSLVVPASAQVPWRANMMGMLSTPASSMGYRDIERFEGYMSSALPYCGSLTPGDYEANRAMVGQWTGYFSQVNAAAQDFRTRAAVVRAWRSIALFPCAYPAGQARPAAAPPPPPQPAPPPFSLNPPSIGNVSAADKETADDLKQRYGLDASKAAAAWNNAQVLKISLGLRNMSVNGDTMAAVGRLQQFLDMASDELKMHNWDEARSNLQAVEATNKKIFAVVGE